MTIRIGSLPLTLFLVFLILKLTHTVAWSWWWVTSPIWMGAALGAAIFSVIGLVALVVVLVAWVKS